MNKAKIYKLALFGNPVSHSLSPKIHKQFARQYDLSIDYQLYEVTEDFFIQSVVSFFEDGGLGANVTLPYKYMANSMAKIVSERAKQSQAVNTFFLDSQQALCGDNTDGTGFINDLTNRCHFDCYDKNILILGAGGATNGILPSIMAQTPLSVTIANRTLKKAIELCTYKNSDAMTLYQLNDCDKIFDLIIHSSSLGHVGKNLEFSKQHIHKYTVCYDLSYAKAAKPFITFTKSMGIDKSFDGIGMLIEQAACAFELWFGVKPSTDNIIV